MLPIQRQLMEALLGHTDEENLEASEVAMVVKALIATAKSKTSTLQVQAAKELLERVYGKVRDIVEIETTNMTWNESKTYNGKKGS